MKANFLILKILVVLFTTNVLASTKITLHDIEEYKVNNKKVMFKITAQSKNIDYQKLKKFRVYNKEKVISNASYYLNGKFSTKDLQLDFKKAYFLEGNFVMHKLNGFFKNSPLRAKKAVFSGNNLFLKEVFIEINNIKYRKIKYNLSLK